MKINRLFEIIYILLNKKSTTAKDLAQHFEVSKRTIYRDIDTLTTAGIPIYTSKGSGGGIYILENFILNKSILSEEEQNQILLGLQSLNVTNALEKKDIINKLSSLFKKENTNWIDVDFSNWSNNKSEAIKFDLLKKSIVDNLIINFTYFNSKGEESTREIEPIKLKFKYSSWYLQGFCLEKKAIRTFKIFRIKDLNVTDKHFISREFSNEDLSSSIINKTPQTELQLWISSAAAYRVFESFYPDDISRNKDGSYLITTSFPLNDWVYSFLLSFGEDLKVLSPAFVQDKIKEKASLILKNYKY
ncbi:MAG: YafY family protein [Clostridiaceae bacterium]|nr:YafY family protein [Clostridiaceae bacterium]